MNVARVELSLKYGQNDNSASCCLLAIVMQRGETRTISGIAVMLGEKKVLECGARLLYNAVRKRRKRRWNREKRQSKSEFTCR